MKRRISTRKFLALAATAALLGSAVATSVQAQPGRMRTPGAGGRPPLGAPGFAAPRARMLARGGHLFAAFERLDLSDAQKEKLRQIRRSAPAALMPKKQAVMEARMDLHDLMNKEQMDSGAARKAHEKVQQARNALESAQFDLRLQARDVLTPEQRKQLRKDLRPGAAWEKGGAHGMDELDGMDDMEE